jgi:hypothetical protein
MRQDTPFAVCHVDGSMTDSDFASSIKREEEPRQALGEHETGDTRGVARQRGGQEWRGDERDAITEVRGGARRPEFAELPPEAAPREAMLGRC